MSRVPPHFVLFTHPSGRIVRIALHHSIKTCQLRKLIASINVSLDGYFSGPDDEMDWHLPYWTEEMDRLLCEQLIASDTIVLGRNTYLKMVKYWKNALLDFQFSRESLPLTMLLNDCIKIVFSRSAMVPSSENTMVITTQEELKRIKEENGRNLLILGSGQLIQSLIRCGMIDELILWIHPVTLLKGKLLFTTMSGNFLLSLKRKQQIDSGVMVMFYTITQDSFLIDE